MYWQLLLTCVALAEAAAPFANGTTNGTSTSNSGPTGTGTATLGTGTGTPGDNPHMITAHPDGQCVQMLNATQTKFEIKDGFPKYTTIKKPRFPGAEAKVGGGYDVWWTIPDPGQGCRSIVMVPYSQNRGTPGYPGGKEIINAGHGGCYFGRVPTDTDLLLSFCCGSDDCAKASLNSTSLLAGPSKRELRQAEIKQRDATKKEKKEVAYSGSPAARAQSLNERYYYPAQPKDNGCTFKAGQPYSQAGQQIIVTSGQSCPDSPCNIAVNSQISFSTTASSSTSQTFTNTVGVSVAVKAGVDFIAEGDITTTLHDDFSAAFAKTTGMDIQHGNSTSITNTIATKLGNMGAVTFTPVYKCWTGPMDCGKGVSDPIDVCQPDMSGANGALKGEYDAVVYG